MSSTKHKYNRAKIRQKQKNWVESKLLYFWCQIAP